MCIKKKTTITFANIVTGNYDKNASTFGEDLDNAIETVNDQFRQYAIIDEKFEVDLNNRRQQWIDVVFTLTFTESSLRLLKLKDYYLYELLEEYDEK
jgi:ribonucleotide reductase alpha subunit